MPKGVQVQVLLTAPFLIFGIGLPLVSILFLVGWNASEIFVCEKRAVLAPAAFQQAFDVFSQYVRF